MSSSYLLRLLCIISLPVFLLQCYDSLPSQSNGRYSTYEPILTDRTTLDKVFFATQSKIVNAGKVYVYNKYVLINEIDKGFHIIDNSNPSTPKSIGFLSVLASHDAVVKNGILYCDNATDLISINFSDITKPTVIGRIQNVFPEQTPPDGLPLDPEYTPKNSPSNTVIISWRKL